MYTDWFKLERLPFRLRPDPDFLFAAEHIAPVLSTLQTKAVIDAISGWDRHLPTSLTVLGKPDGVITDVIGGIKATEPLKPSTK